jgi:hypothetical protein
MQDSGISGWFNRASSSGMSSGAGRPGYRQGTFRRVQRKQAGRAKSQRRFAALHVSQDLRRGGGLSRSTDELIVA